MQMVKQRQGAEKTQTGWSFADEPMLMQQVEYSHSAKKTLEEFGLAEESVRY